MNISKIIFGCLFIVSSIVLSSCKTNIKDIDGNEYGSVSIGEQTWMSQNLNVSHFLNGDSVPEVKSSDEWARYSAEGKPACCTVQNDPENGRKYGKLYNWYAVNDPRGLAPKGWHIPSDDEWTKLTKTLGGDVMAALKMRTDDFDGINIKKESKGFSGLPGGARNPYGEFYGFANYGYWWTSTEYMYSGAKMRVLSYNDCSVNFLNYSKGCGLSVRCIGD
jgi:uncharacterized protein (TIGR02145 family)